MSNVEERIDTLESILGKFIINTDVSLRKLENEMMVFKKEMKASRESSEKELNTFKEEMQASRENSEKELIAFKEDMKAFREESEKDRKKMNQEWSNLAKKLGTIVEDLIAPALGPTLTKYFNCTAFLKGLRMSGRMNGEICEVDAIAISEEMVFMIEARSTPRVNDVKEIKEKTKRFFDFFPEYKGKKLIAIFGSIIFPENVLKYASRSGIYVMGWREWEYMDVLNFDEVVNQ